MYYGNPHLVIFRYQHTSLCMITNLTTKLPSHKQGILMLSQVYFNKVAAEDHKFDICMILPSGRYSIKSYCIVRHTECPLSPQTSGMHGSWQIQQTQTHILPLILSSEHKHVFI